MSSHSTASSPHTDLRWYVVQLPFQFGWNVTVWTPIHQLPNDLSWQTGDKVRMDGLFAAWVNGRQPGTLKLYAELTSAGTGR